MNLFRWIALPPLTAPAATLVLRLMVGSVFLWEGLMKFAFANQGVGRFTKLGMPVPAFTANFVASLEVGGGILLILGLATRFIAIPFIVEMVVAILSTKISLFHGVSPLPPPPVPPVSGIWAVLHEVRSEWAQMMISLFLLLEGPGPISLDARLTAKARGSSRASNAPVAPPGPDRA